MKYMNRFIDVVLFIIDEMANFYIRTTFGITDNLISISTYSNIKAINKTC